MTINRDTMKKHFDNFAKIADEVYEIDSDIVLPAEGGHGVEIRLPKTDGTYSQFVIHHTIAWTGLGRFDVFTVYAPWIKGWEGRWMTIYSNNSKDAQQLRSLLDSYSAKLINLKKNLKSKKTEV